MGDQLFASNTLILYFAESRNRSTKGTKKKGKFFPSKIQKGERGVIIYKLVKCLWLTVNARCQLIALLSFSFSLSLWPLPSPRSLSLVIFTPPILYPNIIEAFVKRQKQRRREVPTETNENVYPECVVLFSDNSWGAQFPLSIRRFDKKKREKQKERNTLRCQNHWFTSSACARLLTSTIYILLT